MNEPKSEWHAVFVEGYAADLAKQLNDLVADGCTLRFLLTNGINRWTVVWTREVETA